MNLVISTYTNQYNTGTASINSSPYAAKLANTDIVSPGSPQYVGGGDGQELKLAGVKLSGRVLEINFTILSGSLGDGFDFIGALFDKHDTNTKTLTMLDTDDSNRSWYVTGRNLGVSAPRGRTMVAKMALDADILYTTNTTTESTFAVVADGQTQDFTIGVGNISALPVIDVVPQTNGGVGQRYWRFCTVYNYTKNPSGPAYHIDITNGGLDTAALINFTSISVTTVGAHNSSVTTIAYNTVVGTLPAVPFMLYRGGEQMRVTARTGTTSGNLTVVRGVNGSVATSHNTAVLALSKMAFDGRDVRVFVGTGNANLTETRYWFGDSGTSVINNTATKIWIPADIAARALGTLTNAITNSDVSLSLTGAEGYFPPNDATLLIESEIVTYLSYDAATATTPDLTRGTNGTTAASHAAGVTVRYIPNILLYYGDATATTPTYLSEASSNTAASQQLRPPFNRASSTNSSWVYTNFAAAIQNTLNEWKPSKTGPVGTGGTTYTKDNDPMNAGAVDPVTDIGVSVINRNNLARWDLTLPFGYTSGAFTTVKRYSLPANAAYVTDGITYTPIAAATGGSSTSATLTSASVSFLLSFLIRNTTSANWGTRAYVNAAACTVTLSTSTTSDTDGVPSVTLGSENSVTYDLYASLTNTTTGASISFKFDNMALSSTLRIDTLNKTVTYITDGRKTNLLPFTPRQNWLELRQGTNTLRWNFLNGVNGTVNVIVKEQYRNNSFG